MAPHLVRPRSFIIPAYAGRKPGRWKIEAGMWVYDAMALFRNTRVHRPLGARTIAAMEPGLETQRLRGGDLFFDCITDDARLTLLNVLDAQKLGAVAVNYAEATAILVEGGKVRGATVKDRLSGEEVQVAARSVVNASGPWSDQVSKMADPAAKPRVRLTKGVHIVVPRVRLGHVRALVLRTPQDDRVFFVVPWGELSLVGTTDTDFDGSPEEVAPEATDVRYLLRAVNHFFPRALLAPEDVVAAYAGLRPLLRQEGRAPGEVSREHALIVGPPGFVSIIGGKLTTYRRMAEDVVREAALAAGLVLPSMPTHRRRLPGGRASPSQPAAAADAIAARFRVDTDVADGLYWLHGSDVGDVLEEATPYTRQRVHPDLPYLRASVFWAFRQELAVTLEDALVRRVPIALRLRDSGASVVDDLARAVGPAAGWSAREAEEQVEAYRASREKADAWRRAI
jgi:glycerol-3-phosphate dehydrogenase